MRKLELLIDALEQDGHPNIRTKINTREEIINRASSLKEILTPEELKTVKQTIDEFKPPTPKGWANALMIHAMKNSLTSYSPNQSYESTELYNLSTSLNQAGLPDPEILRKIIKAADSLKQYENRGDQP